MTPTVTDWLALIHDRLKHKGISRDWYISRNHVATYRCTNDPRTTPEFKFTAQNGHVKVELTHEIARYVRKQPDWEIRKDPPVQGIAHWISRLAAPPARSDQELQLQKLMKKPKSWQAQLCKLKVDAWHPSGLLRAHLSVPRPAEIDRIADIVASCLDAYKDEFLQCE